MPLDYAAHVDHPIAHTSSVATIGLTLAGAAIGAAVVIYSGGTALVVLSTAGSYAGYGMKAGKIIDKFLPPSADGQIATGLDSVLLGPSVKPAARAMGEETTVRCHSPKMVAEGSKTVMLGQGMKPMSRRGDRTDCGGVIVDGIHSIIVGGDRSKEGIPIAEDESTAVKALSTVLGLIGGGTQMAKGGVGNIYRGGAGVTSTVLDATGHGDAAKIVDATTVTKPTNPYGVYSTGKTLYGGAEGAVNITKPLITGH